MTRNKIFLAGLFASAVLQLVGVMAQQAQYITVCTHLFWWSRSRKVCMPTFDCIHHKLPRVARLSDEASTCAQI